MTRISAISGYVGLLISFAAALFALIHQTDFLVLTYLVNLAFLFLAYFVYRSIVSFRKEPGDSRLLRSQILIGVGYFLVTVVLVNLMLRTELARSRILAEPLQKILSLEGKSYEWKRDQFPQEKFPEGRVTGVIAQEIEKVLPELVGTRRDGYKGVAYQEIVPILIEAVKEQQKVIDSQKKEIAEIRILVQKMKK